MVQVDASEREAKEGLGKRGSDKTAPRNLGQAGELQSEDCPRGESRIGQK